MQSDQMLESGGEPRYYMLYVPTGYRCDGPAAPLLVDFHGTAGAPRPEEAYATAELVDLAEARGVIVARPRSRSSMEGGFEIFRWDQNQGDLERNRVYARELVAHLRQRYNIDGARVYASGFSSGSGMTARFIGGRGWWARPTRSGRRRRCGR